MKREGFHTNLEDGRSMLLWAESVIATTRSFYATALGEKADALTAMCPPENVLNDAEPLTSKELQHAIFNNPDRGKLKPAIVHITSLLYR